MNKEILIITGVLVGSFIVANHLMKSKAPKMAETMSNADGGRKERRDKATGGCKCGKGVVGYCGQSVDCATCCANYSFDGENDYSEAGGCGCGGSSNFAGCCGS